ncbi:hypothetical protein DICPUDRAFT_159071 [Dictyostelium purpureum]|uniref:Hydroxymethylglutaryl-CoA synthase n=1 Tax=Dictyostelium purpureum TaxID=5786 RepID=F1A377_DICPU|nr:uncharacterized protein DICPUDRAFT_159071 [Dictyostelium purpureum]EGC29353.1 hypothetical protein DICPUDRAFT_159071 [Dictyostelium purpureum]|eukprot:XP_003294117.1 hypothetical protein DICPUDRAFT_159071 [Dictyostelium purpureum]
MFKNERPVDIGILAMDMYFPKNYVNQTDLEIYDKVSKGKYTIGLGQNNMAFSGDREDIVSMAMTSVKMLMEKYKIDYNMIGRLEVGTETIIDKSKSVKSALMQLFQDNGNNTSIEGVDTMNACYGGTNALFNSVQWIESSFWDGRYALVVCGDIAVYSVGPARPTGGAGVVSMLIGPNAPLVMETSLRGTHMENVHDFYKPDLTSEYPYVDGKLSIECYLRALDKCYEQFKKRYEQLNPNRKFSIDHYDYFCFHSPYNRLVQKSYARLKYNEFLNDPDNQRYKDFLPFKNLSTGKDSYINPKLDQTSLKLSQDDFKKKVDPSTLLSKELGNSYCGSVYSGILSLLSNVNNLQDKRILVFSYGSGLASSFFSFRGNSSNNINKQFPSTRNIGEIANIKERLQNRTKINPDEFSRILATREKSHLSIIKGAHTPIDTLDNISNGTFYLEKVDDKLIRHYKLKPILNSNL